MRAQKCVFCGIISRKISSHKIYEDSNYIAILDIYPNIIGQSLVIPKKHVTSLFYNVDDRELGRLLNVSKKVGRLIARRLRVSRVHLVLEGIGVNHLHSKLYPAAGLRHGDQPPEITEESVYFKKYPGYVTTLPGPRASPQALRKVQKLITD